MLIEIKEFFNRKYIPNQLQINCDIHHIQPNSDPFNQFHDGWLEFVLNKMFNNEESISNYIVNNYMTIGNMKHDSTNLYEDEYLMMNEAYMRFPFDINGIKILGTALMNYCAENKIEKLFFICSDTYGSHLGFLQRLVEFLNGNDITY